MKGVKQQARYGAQVQHQQCSPQQTRRRARVGTRSPAVVAYPPTVTTNVVPAPLIAVTAWPVTWLLSEASKFAGARPVINCVYEGAE